MKRTVGVSWMLVGIFCAALQAGDVPAPRALWDIDGGQLPGDVRNATIVSVPGHTRGGSGRSLEVRVTGEGGWAGEWCSTPANWSGFERLACTVFSANESAVSVYARIKTVAGALATVTLDLPPGFSTPTVELADLTDETGQGLPVDLKQIRQWSFNWNDAFDKPIYISDLRLESGARVRVQPGVPKAVADLKPVQPAAAPTTLAAPQTPAAALPPSAAQASTGTGINWSAVLCVLMLCVTAIIIAAMLRPKKA